MPILCTEYLSHKKLTSGQKFWRETASWGNVNVTPASLEQCIRLCSPTDAIIDFLLRTPRQWLTMLFNEPDNRQKLLYPLRGSGPHLIHDSLGPPKSASKTASQSVQSYSQGSRMCPTDRQTDTQTERPRHSVCSNRPHPSYCFGAAYKLKEINCSGLQYFI